jgi:hypothetical protein
MLHGAGICTPTFTRTKSPSFVGKYTSTMVRIWDMDAIGCPFASGISQPVLRLEVQFQS